MDPRELALLQSQRGQALAIPGRQVQLRGLGNATGPTGPVAPPPPPGAGAQSASLLGVPWWAWALLGVGAYAVYHKGNR
jgi:hypothetical protein